jgi:hypothetical protein
MDISCKQTLSLGLYGVWLLELQPLYGTLCMVYIPVYDLGNLISY